MAPCSACGSKPKKETYVYTAPDGTQKTFSSKVEANAEKARRGGTVQPQ